MRPGRIWICCGRVEVRDIEAFIERRKERQVESADDKLRRRMHRILLDMYRLDRRLVNVGKSYPAAADSLERCAGWMYGGAAHLRDFLRRLPPKAVAPVSPPASVAGEDIRATTEEQ